MTESTLTDPAVRPPTEYRVRARAREDGSAVAGLARTTLDLDTTWGEPPSGRPGPAELLAGAFAACLLKNLARAGDLIGFRYVDAAVDVVARRQDTPPRFTSTEYALTITTDEPPRRVDLVHTNLRKYGTVYNTLAAVCDVSGEVFARPSSGGVP